MHNVIDGRTEGQTDIIMPIARQYDRLTKRFKMTNGIKYEYIDGTGTHAPEIGAIN